MIAIDRLVACAVDELPEDEAREVEEHVLGCTPCAALFERLVALGDALRELVRAGAASFVATRGLVDRLDAARLLSRRYELGPGAIVPCSVGAADIYSCVRFAADLSGVTRVDVERGATRLTDVPFEANEGAIYLVTSSALIRTFPTAKLAFRLIAVDARGERPLGQYTLDHTGFGS